MSTHAIAAQPGTMVGTAWLSDDGTCFDHVTYQPVVAWVVAADDEGGEVHPIGIDHEAIHGDWYVIKFPGSEALWRWSGRGEPVTEAEFLRDRTRADHAEAQLAARRLRGGLVHESSETPG
jgi:hypothetical protein